MHTITIRFRKNYFSDENGKISFIKPKIQKSFVELRRGANKCDFLKKLARK